jgi:hypothetical protein
LSAKEQNGCVAWMIIVEKIEVDQCIAHRRGWPKGVPARSLSTAKKCRHFAFRYVRECGTPARSSVEGSRTDGPALAEVLNQTGLHARDELRNAGKPASDELRARLADERQHLWITGRVAIALHKDDARLRCRGGAVELQLRG